MMRHGTIALRCALIGMARDTYYAHPRRKADRVEKESALVAELRALAEKKQYKLGIRSLTMVYNRKHKRDGLCINHKRVERIKRSYDIPTKIRMRRRRKPEQPKQEAILRIPANVVARNFTAMTPFRLIGSDVTYCWSATLGRFFYVSNARDFATGEYLGWSVSLHNDQELVDATVMHIEARHGADVWKHAIFHVDRGGTYTAPHFQGLLVMRGATPSMSRKGNCIDNAPTESGHGHLKDWLDLSDCATIEEARRRLDDVIYFFNEERQQWTRKKMTPVEYRNHLLSTVT